VSTPHNAVKYTPERGMIQVPHSSATAKSVEVSVTDTGIGIPEAG
jgi:signal transduction histidine kinase